MQGKVLASGPPAALVEQRQAKSLEEAFIKYLEDAGALGAEAKDGEAIFPYPLLRLP